MSKETVLQEAQRIVYGDREQTYGDPGKNLQHTADFWNSYLNNKYPGANVAMSPEDVAIMMALLKIAREMHMHKRDNVVDTCGYMALIGKMEDYRTDEARTFNMLDEPVPF